MIDEPFLRDQGGADTLVEGYYLDQLPAARRVAIPIRIWFGAPLDPETGEEMDRAHRWQIEIAGTPFDQPLRMGGISYESLGDLWPRVARCPIDASEYRFRVERAAWAAENDPDDAMATPGGRIDPMTATLPGL